MQASNAPYQASSETYTLEGRDPGIIAALRSFGRLLNSSNLGGSTAYMKRIKDIRAGVFFDIICQVWCMLYICAHVHGVPHLYTACQVLEKFRVVVFHISHLPLQVLCINDKRLDSPVMFVWDGTDAVPLPFM